MIIGDNAGHTVQGKGTGAVGFINEGLTNREISNHFRENMISLGHKIIDCTVDKSENYLVAIVKKANAQKLDLALSHHLNHSDDARANGVEVWVYDIHNPKTSNIASKICVELEKLGFRNRGVKESKKLAWLKNTKSDAVLIEYCFCSNETDVKKFNAKKCADAVTMAICGENPPAGNSTSKNRYENGDYNRKAMIKTKGSSLNVREARNTNSEVIHKLLNNSIIEVDYCFDNWFSTWLLTDSGVKVGFVHGDYIELL